jgi:hypothetical protein
LGPFPGAVNGGMTMDDRHSTHTLAPEHVLR